MPVSWWLKSFQIHQHNISEASSRSFSQTIRDIYQSAHGLLHLKLT